MSNSRRDSLCGTGNRLVCSEWGQAVDTQTVPRPQPATWEARHLHATRRFHVLSSSIMCVHIWGKEDIIHHPSSTQVLT